MTNQITTDILIIGAGLAGLSAAETILSQCQPHVTILEARHIGSNNPTPLTFTETIQKYRLEEHVKANYHRFSMLSPSGKKSTHEFGQPDLVALDYRGACQEIFRRCQNSGNINLIKAKANDLKRQSDQRWLVTTVDGLQINTPLVLDASGRGLFTTHALGLPGPSLFSHSLGNLLKNVRVPEAGEAAYLIPTDDFGSGGGWFYPLPNNTASVGIAFLSPLARFPGKHAKELFHRAISEFHPICDWLSSAELGTPEAGSIPIFPPRKFIAPGLIRVGDAAGQATIWDCMGSEMALIGGDLAGQAASQSFIKQDYSAKRLELYQDAWDKRFYAIYRQAKLTAPLVWRNDATSWEHNLDGLQQLTPHQMFARLRSNWPLLPLWQVYFLLAYDLAGRIRRGLMRRLRSLFSHAKK